jgi:type IV secretory pathway protease TraF
MQVYDSASLEDQTPEEQETNFADVLEKALNPMLEMCTMMAVLMKADRGEKAKEWDTAVFLVNSLVYLEVSMTSTPLCHALTEWNGCRGSSNHFLLQSSRSKSWRGRWMGKFESSWLPT